ncbi:hypothetical protein OHT76_27150 [Streptomyces sp. NBC_00287]|uniref:hypothetical protein n=1 Tax=Streptomyces sp. NBC_00287 TaxID=2975702 RepID=UPI002E2DA546|nr:hypothetical protein [Streptomyces sp. NBC_00287]
MFDSKDRDYQPQQLGQHPRPQLLDGTDLFKTPYDGQHPPPVRATDLHAHSPGAAPARDVL